MAPLYRVSKADAGSSAAPGIVQAASIDNPTGAVIAACSAAGQGMGAYESVVTTRLATLAFQAGVTGATL